MLNPVQHDIFFFLSFYGSIDIGICLEFGLPAHSPHALSLPAPQLQSFDGGGIANRFGEGRCLVFGASSSTHIFP
jgi:hypothetical protein